MIITSISYVAINLLLKDLVLFKCKQMQANAVHESLQKDTVTIKHTPGSLNLSDLFTKEK